MNYTLHQLQVLLKVSQTKSITKAAEELHLSQPAVSIQLKNLQDQFEIPLTEVVGRKLYMTDFGNEIVLAAENILNEVYAINYKTLIYKGQLAGKLKLSVVSTGKYVIPFFLAGFLNKHLGIELEMDVTNKSKVLESLINNNVDFALVSVLPENHSYGKVELMKNKLYLIGNAEKKYELKNTKEIFKNIPLIYRENGSGTRLVMERYFQKHNIKVVKKMELTSNEAVKQAVVAGLGCSVMPLIGIKNELISGDLQIIPVAGFPIESSWNLVWNKSKNFSVAASSFLNYIKNEKDNIIAQKFSWFDKH
jgi:LysR family transcriptional regulator, low CO2-responsive transcriptional regulator